MVTRIGLVLVGSSSVCESVASLSHVDRVGKVRMHLWLLFIVAHCSVVKRRVFQLFEQWDIDLILFWLLSDRPCACIDLISR